METLGTKYADVMPPLSSDERELLAQSIAAEGVRVPILVDEDGEIIDGKHRYEIAPNCPRQLIAGLTTPAQKKAAAVKFNIARRNMTAEQRDELATKQRDIAKELAAEVDGNGAPRLSQAEIGALLGVTGQRISQWLEPKNESVENGFNTLPVAAEQPKPKKKRKKKRTKLDTDDCEEIWAAHFAGKTNRQIAADFGVSAQRVGQVIKRLSKQKTDEAKAEEDAKKAEQTARKGGVVVGDYRECGSVVANNSVDLIFTDPPYDRKTVPQYADLAAFASRVLVDGGSLITYLGHYALPEILPMMTPFLTFWWINAVVHTGGNKTFPGKFVHVGWKPLLWFVKGGRMSKKVVRDCIISTPGDKAVHHEWAQGEDEARYYIEHLSRKRGLIVDPYVGGGTTGVCAAKAGRRFIGFEINPKTARKAEGRIAASVAG